MAATRHYFCLMTGSLSESLPCSFSSSRAPLCLTLNPNFAWNQTSANLPEWSSGAASAGNFGTITCSCWRIICDPWTVATCPGGRKQTACSPTLPGWAAGGTWRYLAWPPSCLKTVCLRIRYFCEVCEALSYPAQRQTSWLQGQSHPLVPQPWSCCSWAPSIAWSASDPSNCSSSLALHPSLHPDLHSLVFYYCNFFFSFCCFYL